MEESASQPLPNVSVQNASPRFGEMSDGPVPIICTAKCSASDLKSVFGVYYALFFTNSQKVKKIIIYQNEF